MGYAPRSPGTGGSGGGDGAILDGVSAAIKATVKDYTNANPLTVIVVDTNGDPVAGGSSVSVVNGAGGSAVNIQDGGNSITVDGTVAVSGSVAVTGPLTDAQLRATPVPISGTVTITDGLGALNVIVDSSALPSGAATSANQATEIASLANLDVALSTRLKPADTLTAVTTLGTITNVVHVDDNAGSLTVDGTVGVSNFPATQAISAAALPLPANAAQETGGNLATLTAKDFATQTTLAAFFAALALAQGASMAGATGPLIQGVVSDIPNSFFDNTMQPLSLTNTGRLRVSSVQSDVDRVWQHTGDNPWAMDNFYSPKEVTYV